MKILKSKNTKYLLLLLVVASITSSCKKWLDVNSKTEIVSDQQFDDISGFRDAVIGVYVKLAKPELYSMEATWRTVEFLAQQYAEVASAPDLNVPKFRWDTAPLPSKRETIWLGAYNAISNINQILYYQEQNRDVFDRYPITDSLVRGEMLALRAFLHLDIMRLYGKGNLGNRSELKDYPAMPYVTEFTKYPTKQRSYSETMALMRKDIEEAISYLEADPLSRKKAATAYSQEAASGFISTTSTGTSSPNRKMRMNYWAAKALYVRILMWEGTVESKTKALEVALEVIGKTAAGSNNLGEGDGAYYSWVTSAGVSNVNWYANDLAFVNEQLFTLNVENFLTIQKINGTGNNWFYAATPNSQYSVIFLTNDRRNLIFESGTSLIDADWRATKCLFGDGASLTNWTIAKFYNHESQTAGYAKRMPLIRITEMYYMAAECILELGMDKNKAISLLNWVRSKRNLGNFPLPNTLTNAEVSNEITKEFMKEFIGEGQLFYYYKRNGFTSIPGVADEMTDAQYQMPIPDSEITNGGAQIY